jgi:hypothetical protein
MTLTPRPSTAPCAPERAAESGRGSLGTAPAREGEHAGHAPSREEVVGPGFTPTPAPPPGADGAALAKTVSQRREARLAGAFRGL